MVMSVVFSAPSLSIRVRMRVVVVVVHPTLFLCSLLLRPLLLALVVVQHNSRHLLPHGHTAAPPHRRRQTVRRMRPARLVAVMRAAEYHFLVCLGDVVCLLYHVQVGVRLGRAQFDDGDVVRGVAVLVHDGVARADGRGG